MTASPSREDPDADENMPRLVIHVRRVTVSAVLAAIPAALALVATFVHGDLGLLERAAIAYFAFWVSFSGLYIGFSFIVFGRIDGPTLARRLSSAVRAPRRALPALSVAGRGPKLMVVYGNYISMFTVLATLASETMQSNPVIVFLCACTVISSWMLVTTGFSIAYAQQHTNAGCFNFPLTDAPSFNDFFYLAVQVSTTFGPSDVSPLNSVARRMVTRHSITAFMFNAVIVTFMVSEFVSLSA